MKKEDLRSIVNAIASKAISDHNSMDGSPDDELLSILWEFLQQEKRDQLDVIYNEIVAWDDNIKFADECQALAERINEKLIPPLFDNSNRSYNEIRDELNNTKHLLEKANEEISNLKEDLSKFQPGNTGWILYDDCIQKGRVKAIVTGGNYIVHPESCSADTAIEFSKYEVYETAEQCRAEIPIFDQG